MSVTWTLDLNLLYKLGRREVTDGAFPWPKTILKQLKEWHVIVSCNQLGETLRAAPTLLYRLVLNSSKFIFNSEAYIGEQIKKWIIQPWISILMFYTPEPRSQVWLLILSHQPQCRDSKYFELGYHEPCYFIGQEFSHHFINQSKVRTRFPALKAGNVFLHQFQY